MTVRFFGSTLDEARRVVFHVPGDPRGKGRGRAAMVGGTIRVFPEKKSFKYEGQIREIVKGLLADGVEPFVGPVAVAMMVSFAPPKSVSKAVRRAMLAGEIQHASKPDLDNVIKSITDALCPHSKTSPSFLLHDDSLIIRLHAAKTYSERPGVDVRITPFAATTLTHTPTPVRGETI